MARSIWLGADRDTQKCTARVSQIRLFIRRKCSSLDVFSFANLSFQQKGFEMLHSDTSVTFDTGIAAWCLPIVRHKTVKSYLRSSLTSRVFQFITLELELVLTVPLLVPPSQLCHWSCCKEPCPRARCHQTCSLSITWTCSGQHAG